MTQVESSATTICEIDDEKYRIEFGSNEYFNCDNCSEKMGDELKSLVDFDKMDESMNNIEDYFKSHNGTCD